MGEGIFSKNATFYETYQNFVTKFWSEFEPNQNIPMQRILATRQRDPNCNPGTMDVAASTNFCPPIKRKNFKRSCQMNRRMTCEMLACFGNIWKG